MNIHFIRLYRNLYNDLLIEYKLNMIHKTKLSNKLILIEMEKY